MCIVYMCVYIYTHIYIYIHIYICIHILEIQYVFFQHRVDMAVTCRIKGYDICHVKFAAFPTLGDPKVLQYLL